MSATALREDISYSAIPDWFWARVEPQADGCLLWRLVDGSSPRTRYGLVRLQRGSPRSAHRVALELALGLDLTGLHVHHTCNRGHCVNPLHLEAMTPQEHAESHEHIGGQRHRTHCKRGHEFTPENTRQRGRSRVCRACHRWHQAQYDAERRAR